MSWTCIECNKKSVAKKRHNCAVCDGYIDRGEEQITRVGVESGEGWVRMHMHIECEEYSRDWDCGDWESGACGTSRKEIRQELGLPPL